MSWLVLSPTPERRRHEWLVGVRLDELAMAHLAEIGAGADDVDHGLPGPLTVARLGVGRIEPSRELEPGRAACLALEQLLDRVTEPLIDDEVRVHHATASRLGRRIGVLVSPLQATDVL